MADPISGVKFISGVAQPKTHLKALAYVIIIAFWVFVGYGVYKAYFKKVHTESYKQVASQITNEETHIYQNAEADSFFLGIKLPFFFSRSLKLGLSIPKEVKQREVK